MKVSQINFRAGEYITVDKWKWNDNSYTHDVLEVISVDKNLLKCKIISSHNGMEPILNTKHCDIRRVSVEFANKCRKED